MQYQRLTEETTTIIDETGESHVRSLSLNVDRKIHRARRTILSLLFIQLVSGTSFDHY